MVEENGTPLEEAPSAPQVSIEASAFNAAPKLHSHQEIILETTHEVGLAFGIASPFPQAEGSPSSALVPHTVIFMTTPHFKEFASAMVRQVAEMEKRGK